jgi:uroporphyrinogen decarboxylase
MNKLKEVLINKNNSCNPVWFMRQAGRYLPEFQQIRSTNKDFIKLCLNTELSSEITLQPIKRFNLDAAIIFSDILMVPFSLGQEVKFTKNFGPQLSNFNLNKFLNNNNSNFTSKLKPVYKAITKTRKILDGDKSLISFIGSPWTLVIYMLKLKSNKKEIDLDLLEKKKEEISIIIKEINNFLCLHIKNQISAGANVVQIFDSWAGLLPDKYLVDFCFEPNRILVDFCKKNKIPVICFPKGLNKKYLDFYNYVKPDGLSIDYDVEPDWVRNNLDNVTIQGGMDPKILLLDEKVIFAEAKKYLTIFKDFPYIFNLGHGLLPNTSPDKLSKLINFIRNF